MARALEQEPGVAPEPAPEPAIELTDVTVRYAMPQEMIASLKEYAIRSVTGRITRTEIFALRDTSFICLPGERVGVIGPNGAGKSTLFKVIARVVRPSSGRAVVRGHVAPLLELGLGFHGELTGRENILLQGALMGRSRKEMEERTPRIAAFAEMETFLDAPIRTYSTGMVARLAFSAATDVEPDVLLVDEALSVGDERFRAKCRERMDALTGHGRTFLLVSHSLGDIVDTCTRVLWIDGGRIVKDGPAREVTEAYHEWSVSAGATAPFAELSGPG